MRNVYLVFAVIGTVIPCYFFYGFFFGPDSAGFTDFLPALFVNGATGGLAADIFISSFAFWAYMWSRKDKGPGMLPFVILNLCIGLSLALPAYLYVASGERYVNA